MVVLVQNPVLFGPLRKFKTIDTYKCYKFTQAVSIFAGIEYQKLAILYAMACLIVVVVLIHFNNLYNQEIEQFGAFKLSKKKVLSGEAPRYTTAIFGVSDSMGFHPLLNSSIRYAHPKDADLHEVARFIGDKSRRNHVKKPTKTNYTRYVYGFISRIVCLMQACFPSNFKTFNLDPKIVPDWGVNEVIAANGISFKNFAINVATVKEYVRTTTHLGGLPITQIRLADPGFISKFESEIFG